LPITRDLPGRGPRPRRRLRTHLARAAGLAACLALTSCASLFDARSNPPSAHPPRLAGDDAAIYQRVEQERAEHLEHEVERLRADLRHAEESMVAIESGLRGVPTRADAVSALAEARIAVERGGQSAPWREREAREAQDKLEEAERQFQAEHFGSAVFFASRARRIADTLNEEGGKVARSSEARFVVAPRANLRAGPSPAAQVLDVLTEATPVFSERKEESWVLLRTPSGQVGWVHQSLLGDR
jgi:hypothetical protein